MNIVSLKWVRNEAQINFYYIFLILIFDDFIHFGDRKKWTKLWAHWKLQIQDLMFFWGPWTSLKSGIGKVRTIDRFDNLDSYLEYINTPIILGLMIGRVVWSNPYFQIWTSNIKKKESNMVRRKEKSFVSQIDMRIL